MRGMAVIPRRNAGKPWMPEELDLLRRLADAGVRTGEIADRLERSIPSVSKQAERLRVSIRETSARRSSK